MTKEQMLQLMRQAQTIVQEEDDASPDEIRALDEIFAEGLIVLSPWESGPFGPRGGTRRRRAWMRFDGDSEAQYIIGLRTWRTMQGAPRDGKPILMAPKNRAAQGIPEIMVWRRHGEGIGTAFAWQCPIMRAGEELRPRVIVKAQEDQYLWLPCPRLQGNVPVSNLDAPAERDRIPVEEPAPKYTPRRVSRKISV